MTPEKAKFLIFRLGSPAKTAFGWCMSDLKCLTQKIFSLFFSKCSSIDTSTSAVKLAC